MRPGLPGRRPSSFPLLVLGFLLCGGCGPPTIPQQPLPRGAAAPIQRPEVRLTRDAQPVEPGSTSGYTASLTLTGAGYDADHDGRAPDSRTLYVLTFREDTPDSPRLSLSLSADRSYVPRLDRGTAYTISYFLNHRGMFLPAAQGVAIRDADGQLLYALSSDEAVPLNLLPDGLKLRPSHNKAFVTSRLTLSGCTVTKEHHFLEIEGDDARQVTLAPGEERLVTAAGQTWRVVLFDSSVSEDDIECLAESPPHFSYLLERVESSP